MNSHPARNVSAARARRLRRWSAGLAVALGLLAVAPVVAVEITATGLSVPFFDEAGNLTRKLTARRADKAGAVQQLREIEVVYYAMDAGKPVPTQRLHAADATWNEQKEVLTGDGVVTVETPINRITGRDFEFTLAPGQLLIRRDFTMESTDLRLTSDRATVDLVVQRSGETVKVEDVKRCEATGNLHVVVLPTATKTYNFQEAFSEFAVYDGKSHTITLPTATRFLAKGRTWTSDTFDIRLDPATRPATKLKN